MQREGGFTALRGDPVGPKVEFPALVAYQRSNDGMWRENWAGSFSCGITTKREQERKKEEQKRIARETI